MNLPEGPVVTEEEVGAVYRAILRREPEPGRVNDVLASRQTLGQLVRSILRSSEYKRLEMQPAAYDQAHDQSSRRSDCLFTRPDDLKVTETPLKRVLLVGQCLIEVWPRVLRQLGFTVEMDFLLLRMELPATPPNSFQDYSFQITGLPARELFHDYDYFRWIRDGFRDLSEAERLFDMARRRLDLYLRAATTWNRHFPVLVTNIPRHQYSVNGRLARTYDLRDNIFLIDRINEHLAHLIQDRPNVYLLDLDQLSGIVGRRFVQDDSLCAGNHGGLIAGGTDPADLGRLIRPDRPSDHFLLDANRLIAAAWIEAEGMYRTLRQIDAVKMVCIDLDDTLWRGVLSEEEEPDFAAATEGWPLGICEALLALKRRGVLLALVSKNTESRVREIFDQAYRQRLALEDFAILKINWRPKVDNVREAIQEANLLPQSVVFLDDNPVERAAIKAGLPEVRVIEASHYLWKQILLWCSETQPKTITDESSRRTEMVRFQVEREELRTSMSRADFLNSLEVELTLFEVKAGTKKFDRALELLNKTNQFNTTGQRWTAQDLETACAGARVFGADVSDRYTHYGLVLVAIVSDARIDQIVMSCRVISLEVEIAAVALISERLMSASPVVRATSIETRHNLLSRDLYQRCGWSLADGHWEATSVVSIPPHVRVRLPEMQT